VLNDPDGRSSPGSASRHVPLPRGHPAPCPRRHLRPGNEASPTLRPESEGWPCRRSGSSPP